MGDFSTRKAWDEGTVRPGLMSGDVGKTVENKRENDMVLYHEPCIACTKNSGLSLNEMENN